MSKTKHLQLIDILKILKNILILIYILKFSFISIMNLTLLTKKLMEMQMKMLVS